jgi:hypothetical protein
MANGKQPKARKIYTESQFGKLNDLIGRLQAIQRQAATLAEIEASIRVQLLEIGMTAINEDDKTAFPGGEIEERREAIFDPEKVMEWIWSSEGNMYAAGNLVTVGPELAQMMLGQAIIRPEMRRALVINPSGVNAAIIKGTHKDIPHDGIKVKHTLKIRADALKTGDALREELDIIPDDVAAEETAAEDEE